VTLVDLVAAADCVALDGSCVACVPEVTTIVGRVVVATALGAVVLADVAAFAVTSSVGAHAGSWVAWSADERVGRATDWFTDPPATMTAPTDSGPLNSWTIPIMPVRMNVVMSHNCQRLVRTPMKNSPK
jgi:hypothetical protein